MFEQINAIELAAVATLGISLVVAVLNNQTDIAVAIGSGLVGYIGGTATKK